MTMIIEEHWEKVVDNGTNWRDVIKGEYCLKSSTPFANHGWQSVSDFGKKAKGRHDFLGEVAPGYYKFDLGTHYGIHSYQIVRFTN